MRGVCPAGVSAGEAVRAGVLTAYLPPELVDKAVARAARPGQRRCKLPPRAVVYLLIALCLLAGSDCLAPPGYRAVMAALLRGLPRRGGGYCLPVSSAFTRARQRLGAAPLQWLFEATRGPVARPGDSRAFALGLRLAAWDGTLIQARDLPALAAELGPANGSGAPQVRLVTLIECGTRALLGAAFGGARDNSELALAGELTSSLGPGTLLLADRLFPSYPLWDKAAATGADLLWRARLRNIYHPVRRLDDGTWLAIMPTPRAGQARARARHRGRPAAGPPDGHLIRVIDYHLTLTGPAGPARTQPFRLITTLTDPDRYPARDLAALYARRWEAETSNSDLKCRLKGTRHTLRSGTPDLATQEIWALLVAYQALCRLAGDAAATASPARVSFTVTLRAARATISSQATVTPAALRRTRAATITEILAQPLPPPRTRTQARLLKPPAEKYPAFHRGQRRPPGTITRTLHLDPATPAHAP
jgi:Insertion element 4 transposase N-terminal/Transposase DDE domain